MFLNRHLEKANLKDLYKGASVFLFGGGKSISPRHIELSRNPGIVTASLNEAGHYIRPDIYLAMSTIVASHAVMSDSKVTKFIPKHMRNFTMYEDRFTNKKYHEFPNIFLFNYKFYNHPKNFLNDNDIYFQRYTDNKMNSSALILLNILVKLGFLKIYLVGLDFYGRTNRSTYFYDKTIFEIANEMKVEKIVNTFKIISKLKMKTTIFNTNRNSPLNEFFPYKDFDEAIKENTINYASDINKIHTSRRFKWSKDRLPRRKP